MRSPKFKRLADKMAAANLVCVCLLARRMFASLAEQSSSASGELSAEAERLARTIGQFRLAAAPRAGALGRAA